MEESVSMIEIWDAYSRKVDGYLRVNAAAPI